MNEQPKKRGIVVGQLLRRAWVRLVGWGSTISHLVGYATGGLRQRFGGWWQKTGLKMVARGLARLAALILLGVMAFGVVNYTYKMYSFRQPFLEPQLEQGISLDLESVLPGKDMVHQGGQEEPSPVTDKSVSHLTLGPEVAELFPIGSEAVDPGIEAMAASTGSREGLSTGVDVTTSRIQVNPANMIWPTQGQVKVGYGWVRHPVYRDWRFHPGIELSTPTNAPALAVMDGRIEHIQSERTQGLTVTLTHGDDWQTVYRGLAQLRVREGEIVKRGQIIGIVGLGEDSQHGRLLFEIRQGDTPLEPRMYLP